MTHLKATIEVTIILIGFIVMVVVIPLFILNAHASDSLSGKLIVDFPKEEARYTESHSFGVKTTATVLPSECNTSDCGACLCTKQPSECLDVCEEVILTY